MESLSRLPRRTFLKMSSLAGLSWLTPLGHLLAQQAEKEPGPARSVILLWLAGGPSQLETFDPHPGTNIAGGTKAIAANVKGVQLAEGFERTAQVMDSVSLIRSLVSKEGDHERGTYFLKTGYRPDPTAVHPSIGAICCHELPKGNTDIPRHISILPGRWPSRGGFLGDEYDAFKTGDPIQPLPDVVAQVPTARDEERTRDLEVVERAFARGRRVQPTLHTETVQNARIMMHSEQLKAFDVSREPLQLRREYGETAFGRGCLAARRLIEVGVRCVEITLDGWDSHVNNHSIHRERIQTLDPAFAALIRDLKQRDLLRKTVVLCCGEFGRTPQINPAGGRDHWPTGFSLAIAGGNIKGGRVVGATDPDGSKEPIDPVRVENIHATVLNALGLDPFKENISPAKRPLRLSQGTPVAALVE
jgi:Protein of unknown function (DUF1501)